MKKAKLAVAFLCLTLMVLYLVVPSFTGNRHIMLPTSAPTESDAIDNLVHKLNSDTSGLWVNGGYPNLELPEDAQPDQVVARAIQLTGFDEGPISRYDILEVRSVTLNTGMGNYSAALIDSNLGPKIILFRYEGKAIGWWTRFY